MKSKLSVRQAPRLPFTSQRLKELIRKGYKFVQVMGLTADCHYDVTQPHCILLVPMRELPGDNARKDVYEPIDSEIIAAWAEQVSDYIPVTVSSMYKNARKAKI
jgi:hypothetical protein